MRSISQTSVFTDIEKTGLFNIIASLKDPNIAKNFSIDKDLIETQILQVKSFKYPLLKYILESFKKKEIGLILLSESKDPSVKPLEKFPTSIGAFKLADGVNYANTSSKASYIWNGGKTEVTGLRLTDREFYSYMQSAFVFMLMTKYDARLSSNLPFLKDMTEIYVLMFTKFIDKSYPISNDRETLAGLMYLVAKFFLEYAVGISGDRVTSVIKQIRFIDKSVLDISLGDPSDIPTIGSFEEFIAVIQKYFPHLRDGSMNKRQLLYKYTSMYGANAIFAIENPFSFINMIFSANMRVGLFSDRGIDAMAANYVDKIEKTLAAICATLPL